METSTVPTQPTANGGYSIHQVVEMSGLKQNQIRNLVRRELIAPTRGYRDSLVFSFRDAVLARSIRVLCDEGVSMRTMIAAYLRLREKMGTDKSLSALRLCAGGTGVLVQERDTLWDPKTNQIQLDFTPKEQESDVTVLDFPAEVRRSQTERQRSVGKILELTQDVGAEVSDPDKFDSDDWYNLAMELESLKPEKAPDAYRQSIRLNPRNADAYVNLGRLYQLGGDLRRAKLRYQDALRISPAHPLANYNMGTLFDELDEIDTAVSYYMKAPRVADAHYNLGRIFEMRGDTLNSRHHFQRYEQLKKSGR